MCVNLSGDRYLIIILRLWELLQFNHIHHIISKRSVGGVVEGGHCRSDRLMMLSRGLLWRFN